MSPFRPLSTMESVALYPENGDVVHLRCGRVTWHVRAEHRWRPGCLYAERVAVVNGETLGTFFDVPGEVWRDLVRLGASSVERAQDVMASIHEVLATPGGGA